MEKHLCRPYRPVLLTGKYRVFECATSDSLLVQALEEQGKYVGCTLHFSVLNIIHKNITGWGKQWFERELSTVEVQGEGEEVVQISEVTEVDGDIELGQRKSK